MFLCPVCNSKLNIDGKAYTCENNHSFDIAKQGYVNLLPSNKKHSDNPGDSKDMVLARREFLESGNYDCFSNALCEIIGELFDARQKISILDCGCGEGFYDGKITAELERLKIDYSLFGVDISKEAVRLAAGKYKNASFIVGSCFDLPVESESTDLLIDVFAPMVEKEFGRVLKTGGYLIYAVPGKNHLMGLKRLLYENVYSNEEKHTEYDDFEFIERVSVKDEITLDGEMGVKLFKMTPYYFKTELGAEEKIRSVKEFTTEIHFDFLIYKKI